MVRVRHLALVPWLPWCRRILARVQRMTGRPSLLWVFLAYVLLQTRTAAPVLLHAMGSDGAGSGVCLRVDARHMHAQPIPVHLLPTMFTATFFEHARPPVPVLRAMMPLMLQKSTAGEVPAAEFALRILGGQRFHFPMSNDSAPEHK